MLYKMRAESWRYGAYLGGPIAGVSLVAQRALKLNPQLVAFRP